MVLCDRPGVEVLRSEWVQPQYLFPIYAQSTAVHKRVEVAKDIDVVYVGGVGHTTRSRRSRFLERLAKLNGRYCVIIAHGAFGDDYTRLLNRGRIVFNHSMRGELNLRVFETLACGSVLFLEEGNRGAEGWFEDGPEVVFYNENNFEERLAHYLEHPDEAEGVARRGCTRAREFAGENRLTALIDWAAEQPRGARRFIELPSEEQDYQTVLMYANSWVEAARRLEERLVPPLLERFPEEARAWTAAGWFLINPYRDQEGREPDKDRLTKSFDRAWKLAPSSAPYALNAAWAYRECGVVDGETARLEDVLAADSLEGAESVVGEYRCPFQVRWLRAVAERRATLDMIQSEAHVRLATIHAAHGQLERAEGHLATATARDPENLNGIPLWAETRWTRGRCDEAVEILRANLSQFPFDGTFRGRLVEMLRACASPEEAAALEREGEVMSSACFLGVEAHENYPDERG